MASFGRHCGFKIQCPQGHPGSSPGGGAILKPKEKDIEFT